MNPTLSFEATAVDPHQSQAPYHKSQYCPFVDYEPRIYVLASKPSIPGQAESCDWSIELHIPPTSTLSQPPSPTTLSTRHRHSFLSGFHLKKHGSARHSPERKPRASQPDLHHYFTSSSPTPSQSPPIDTILRIRLPPTLPLSGNETPKSLIDQVLQSIPAPTVTDSSQTWLPKALRILQMRDILPPADQGFDVSKFISFAGAYLERTLHGKGMHSHMFSVYNTPASSRPGSQVVSRAASPTRAGGRPSSYKESHHHDLIHQLHAHALAQSHEKPHSIDGHVEGDNSSQMEDTIEEVDYLAVLRQNMRLKRMLSSDVTDYCVVNGEDELTDIAVDDYGNPVDHKNKPVKKGFGGFWFTKGSGRSHTARTTSVERMSRETWQRRDDVYGGLM